MANITGSLLKSDEWQIAKTVLQFIPYGKYAGGAVPFITANIDIFNNLVLGGGGISYSKVPYSQPWVDQKADVFRKYGITDLDKAKDWIQQNTAFPDAAKYLNRATENDLFDLTPDFYSALSDSLAKSSAAYIVKFGKAPTAVTIPKVTVNPKTIALSASSGSGGNPDAENKGFTYAKKSETADKQSLPDMFPIAMLSALALLMFYYLAYQKSKQ